MRIKIVLIAPLLSLALVAPVAVPALEIVVPATDGSAEPLAGSYEVGVAAHDSGDFATALREFRALAEQEQGHVGAAFYLGFMYDFGEGVPQDFAEAAWWYRKAAGQGLARAQFNLGVLYDKGLGVPQDYVEAYKWFNLAAAQNNEVARKKRDIIAERMTPADISEAQRLAREWRPK